MSIPFPINQGALEILSPIAARKRFEKEVPEKIEMAVPFVRTVLGLLLLKRQQALYIEKLLLAQSKRKSEMANV
jgi:hypothetical protein